MTKYIFVTGGVISGLKKGLVASSLAALLKARGLKVFIQKFDPYLNVTNKDINPYLYGENFLLSDGTEADIDLGHYERFLDEELNKLSYITSGLIYKEVLEKERKNEYFGEVVQIVPHVTDQIKEMIYSASSIMNPDVHIVEIGGTVGDIEVTPFIEAIRQMRVDIGVNKTIYVHTTYLPYLEEEKELKTKPTQHSVKTLMSNGVVPDFIVLRSDRFISEEIKKTIAAMTTMAKEHIIALPDVKNTYEIPFVLYHQKFDKMIIKRFRIENTINLKTWIDILDNNNAAKKEYTIGIISKDEQFKTAYKSILEALNHAAIFNRVKVKFDFINSKDLNEEEIIFKLIKSDGIIIPEDDVMDISGKLHAIKYAREKEVPLLAFGMGMHDLIIEFTRNVLMFDNANSEKYNENSNILVSKANEKQFLGNYEINIKEESKAYSFYKSKKIIERHKNNYIINNEFKEELEKNGFIISGYNETEDFTEIVELKDHPFFIGTQFFPQFKSRPNNIHPLFYGFIKEIIKKK